MNRLDQVRRMQGTLDPEQDALRNRCDRYVKRLKGTDPRRRRDVEGFDDTNTYQCSCGGRFSPRIWTGQRVGSRHVRGPQIQPKLS